MSLRSWLTGLVRVGDFIPGQTYSLLDSAVQVNSTAKVEAFFSNSSGATAAGRALSRFLGDDDGVLALKKSYLGLFEGRARVLAIRAVPPERHGFGTIRLPSESHPIDGHAAELVRESNESVAVQVPARFALLPIRIALSGVMYFLAFFVKALHVLLFQGGRSEPVRCVVAAPDIQPLSDFKVIDDALAEQAPATLSWYRLTIVRERGLLEQDLSGTLPVVDPRFARVPRREWVSGFMLPGLCLFARLAAVSIRHAGDVRVQIVTLMAMQQACSVLKLELIARTVRCDYYLDWVEYNEFHILRNVLLRKRGGGVFRWPHSSLYAPGVFTSYIGYDIFCSNGPYPIDRYRHTWSKKTDTEVVGYLQFDRRYLTRDRVAPEYRATIERQAAAGKTIIAYFCSSDVAGLTALENEALASLYSALGRSHDWYLVIKPKSHNKQHVFDMILSDPRLSAMMQDDRVLLIRYPHSGEQVCSTGWLVDQMQIGVGLLGSISAEALTRQRAFFSYYPVFDMTEHSQRLIDRGYLHTELDTFEAALESALDAPEALVYDHWYFANFDPFRDDRALTRTASKLMKKAHRTVQPTSGEK